MAEVLAVGRIVHFMGYTTEGPDLTCVAAIVTTVRRADEAVPSYENGERAVGNDTGIVNLFVFTPSGSEPKTGVRYSEEKTEGTWHWPEKKTEVDASLPQ
jgi:hypothetical protein